MGGLGGAVLGSIVEVTIEYRATKHSRHLPFLNKSNTHWL